MEYVLSLSTKESKMKGLLPMTRMKCNKLSINEFEVINIWKKSNIPCISHHLDLSTKTMEIIKEQL
jgi:hypothetical protein